jgi:tetratricopeptide (TPR) repeat protein
LRTGVVFSSRDFPSRKKAKPFSVSRLRPHQTAISRELNMKSLNLTYASAAVIASLVAAMPAHAATLMVGKSPSVACQEGAAMDVARNEVSISTNRDSIANCTEALSGKMSEADRTAALANRGIIETAAGNTGAALADFNAALARNPQLANVYVNRGTALLKTGRFEEARTDFNHAIELGADNQAVAYFDRGMAEEKLGNLSAAYHDYKSAQNLAPDFRPASVELARFQVADPRYASR